jgi:hypothetical protein
MMHYLINNKTQTMSDTSDTSDRNEKQEYPPICYRCDFKPESKQQYEDHCSIKHRGVSGYPGPTDIEYYSLKPQGMPWEFT